MNKIAITKAVANNVIGFGIGAAVTSILNQHRKHSDNVVLEKALDGTALVTGFAVAGTVQEPVRNYTERQIDNFVAWWNENFTNHTL